MQQRGVERRAAIQDAAVELLTTQGTAAVTHRQVAERAGVAHASIRYYFATREALLLACLQAVERERAASTEQEIAEVESAAADLSVEATAGRIVRCVVGPNLDDDALRGALGWLVDTTRESDALGAELAAERVGLEAQAARLLRAGGFGGVAPEIAVALTEGALLKCVVEKRPGIADAATRAVVALLAGVAR